MTMMSSTSDKKSNFFFANCLQCEGIIRVPITIRPDSSVGCPHCDTQFDLYALLDQIPEVSVEEGSSADNSDSTDDFQIDTGSSTEQQDGKFVVPPQLAAGMRKRRRRRRRSSSESSSGSRDGSRSSGSSSRSGAVPSSSSSTSIDPSRQLSEAEELRLARRQERAQKEREKLQQQREAAALRNVGQHKNTGASKSGSRRKEPKRSPVLEAVKIVIGGFLAAPIAYLLLMWVFSRDPLNLVPTLNNYVPALVPDALVLDEETADSIPKVKAEKDSSIDSMSSLPIPETDPDDVDLGLEIYK